MTCRSNEHINKADLQEFVDMLDRNTEEYKSDSELEKAIVAHRKSITEMMKDLFNLDKKED